MPALLTRPLVEVATGRAVRHRPRRGRVPAHDPPRGRGYHVARIPAVREGRYRRVPTPAVDALALPADLPVALDAPLVDRPTRSAG